MGGGARERQSDGWGWEEDGGGGVSKKSYGSV